MRRQIRATCKKYNISSDGNYMTWVVDLEFDLELFQKLLPLARTSETVYKAQDNVLH